MDANILLGLSLYTLIGLAPLLYNYYVVTRRRPSVEVVSSTKASKSSPPKPVVTSNAYTLTRSNPVTVTNTLNPLVRNIGGISKSESQVRPVIILVVNSDEVDSDIRRLVVRYLTRGTREREDSMASIVGGQNAGIDPGVISIGSTQIAEMEA